jgi:hypothetical protein
LTPLKGTCHAVFEKKAKTKERKRASSECKPYGRFCLIISASVLEKILNIFRGGKEI